MPDLDTDLTALRAGLRAGLTRPDLADVVGRARQRVVRRRMQTGAVLAVLAASLAVPLIRVVPADQRAAPTPVHWTYDIDFADLDHGYALGTHCQETDEPCSVRLLATEDGGANWALRTVPDKPNVNVRLTVVDERSLILRGNVSDHQYAVATSGDGGATWRHHDTLLSTAPRQIPQGAVLRFACASTASPTCETGVGAAVPGAPSVAPALSQPPLVDPRPGAVATAGGRYWVVGTDQVSGKPAVAVTSDGGTTWATTPLDPPDAPAADDQWALVEGGGELFLTLYGAIGIGPYGLVAVFHSRDAGRTWIHTWRPTSPLGVLQGMDGEPVLTRDGRLLVRTLVAGTFESTDAGRTFRNAARELPGTVTWTRAGYLAARPDNTFVISRDGVRWRTIRLS